MLKISKSQLVEIVLTGEAAGNQQTKIQFNDQPYLRRKKIVGLEILSATDTPKSPTNNDVTTSAVLQKSYLTLYLNDPASPNDVGEWIQQVPLPLLHRLQNSANEPFVRELFALNQQIIYWEKCYITLPTPVANTANVSYLLQVYFL